ncbi:MAG: ribose-phosphate pyrophosphokinase [Candidatus Cloacimonadota bacterium]|nr:MAG: ribose-phosphate pyrophosphokinase [Candidatus Cloacimonadota bacterium]
MLSKVKIFTGRANPLLAEKIVNHLADENKFLDKIEIKKFANDNSFVKIKDSVRGYDVFVIQPTCRSTRTGIISLMSKEELAQGKDKEDFQVPGVNDNVMELLIMIDTLKRASAGRINCIIPYYGYARSDKKDQPRVPVTAKLIADLLTAAGADRIITMDLHSGQIQGFFDIPVDHLTALSIFKKHFEEMLKKQEIVIVSPDAGGANRARGLADALKCNLAIGDKVRKDNNDKAEVMNIIGEVKGKTAIIFDDIIDTGGTIVKIAYALKNNGAKRIFAACTHGVLSGNAITKLSNSVIEKIFITDTIPIEKGKCDKIEQLSVSYLLSRVIRNIHIDESVSFLGR